jgi:glyoxylase-like metal-dependent hydrolase (beta-lactamase superfamily II)
MRIRLLATLSALAALTPVLLSGQLPLKQELEVLQRGPARIDKVGEGLFVVRGPFVPCGTRGCRPGGPDDGLIHEAGDVAVRVTPAGLILVDDKYPEFTPEVLARVRDVSAQPIRYLLNSHHHGDHASGNSVIREMGIDIIAHRNIRANFLRLGQPGEPNITFADEGAVYLGGVEVRMRWLGRGHTNGDTVIHFPDLRAVHAGDLVIDGMPVIDYPGGGSARELETTLERLLTLDFETVIPGHGRVMTKDDVRAYRARVIEMNRRMRELTRRGVPREAFATLGGARTQLRLAELGWDNSVSTTAWYGSMMQYYDEMAAAP